MVRVKFSKAAGTLVTGGPRTSFCQTNAMRPPRPQSKQIKSVKRSIKKLQSHEDLKWLDWSSPFTGGAAASVAIPNTGLLVLLNGTTIGDGPIGVRQGDHIAMTSIRWNLHFLTGTTSASVPTEIRMIVFIDKQSNAGLPFIYRAGGSAGLLDATTFIGATTISGIHAPYNHPAMRRYKIIYDKHWTMTSPTANSAATAMIPGSRQVKRTKKLNKMVRYTDADPGTGDQTDIISGALYVVFLSSDPTPLVNVFGNFRLFYKDG